MEVTQGTQRLNNSVRLVANKTTYVRFYARANGDNAVTTASLTVTKNGSSIVLYPSNPGGEINVLPNPNRKIFNQSFLFQLPEAATTAGTFSLSATVAPVSGETNTSNNTATIGAGVLEFENVPSLDLVIYNIGYRLNGVDHFANDNDRVKMIDWMRRAYPVSQINFQFRKESIREALGADRLPGCEEVNNFLATKRIYDLQTNSVTTKTRYYGMVADTGDFLRGCADGLPGFNSSGLTGRPNANFSAWDTDGTYGDWYGAHEVAHNLERYHAEFCDASAGRPFPNPGGSISPTTTGLATVFGFDIGTGAIYDTTWTDNLAYCDRQWLSDFSHDGVMTFIQQNLSPLNQSDYSALPPVDSLLISGTIYPNQTPAIRLNPAFLLMKRLM